VSAKKGGNYSTKLPVHSDQINEHTDKAMIERDDIEERVLHEKRLEFEMETATHTRAQIRTCDIEVRPLVRVGVIPRRDENRIVAAGAQLKGQLPLFGRHGQCVLHHCRMKYHNHGHTNSNGG
jgi:hypothetical protein